MNDFTATQPICHFHHTINTWYIQGIGWTCSYCRQDGIEYKVLTKNEARKILFDPPVVEKDQTKWCANKNCDGPFIPKVQPTEKNYQLYCSLTCKRAAKAHRRAEREQALNELKGETPREPIVDEIHAWKSEPKSFHEFGSSVDVKGHRIPNGEDVYMYPDVEMTEDEAQEVMKLATKDTELMIDFGFERNVKYGTDQIRTSWNYFYNIRRDEAVKNKTPDNLRDRIIAPKRLSQTQFEMVKHRTWLDVEKLVRFGSMYQIRFNAEELMFIYDYFYKKHRTEATL